MTLPPKNTSGFKWLVSLCMAGLAGLSALLVMSLGSHPRPDAGCATRDRVPLIRPDYSDVVIPPNIAPLNFVVDEPGTGCFVRVSGDLGDPIEAFYPNQKVVLPERAWHDLVAANQGGHLSVAVYIRSVPNETAGVNALSWMQFNTITITIAAEAIDNTLVYRRIRPGHTTWREMGIYQRNLETFEERPILTNAQFKEGCVNCHTFCQNQPDKMAIGIRSAEYGSPELLVDHGQVHRIGTKFGYTTWHPSGRIVTFSVNKVRQVFRSAASEVRDVLDFDSFMASYQCDTGTVDTSPSLADKLRLETYPTWSPDGKYLYFSSAPLTWGDQETLPKDYDQTRYDLVRISYDLDSDTWGELETVLSAEAEGRSILLPRISPDGRWLLVSMCDYGCFPVYRASSDLYRVDLTAPPVNGQRVAQRLDINSQASESWHSFSSNGRWIVFSSKRLSHIFTRTFIAYMDVLGDIHKPFVLPQKAPDLYDSYLWTFSVPELITKPVQISPRALAQAVRDTDSLPILMPVTMATPKAGTGAMYSEPLRE
ncbi:MAG: hypothetical protein K9N55_12065 [Phycisphaerae bacterium]|nr:hypothetical protein [Phycisphaerae bacterium]